MRDDIAMISVIPREIDHARGSLSLSLSLPAEGLTTVGVARVVKGAFFRGKEERVSSSRNYYYYPSVRPSFIHGFLFFAIAKQRHVNYARFAAARRKQYNTLIFMGYHSRASDFTIYALNTALMIPLERVRAPSTSNECKVTT